MMVRSAALALLCLTVPIPALAQTPAPPARAATPSPSHTATAPARDSRTLRAAAAHVRFDVASAPGMRSSLTALPRTQRTARMGIGERIGWTVLAGAGGFFAGGYLGAALEGDSCGCDDPGLQGALIGMPIGAATAAIATWVWTGR